MLLTIALTSAFWIVIGAVAFVGGFWLLYLEQTGGIRP